MKPLGKGDAYFGNQTKELREGFSSSALKNVQDSSYLPLNLDKPTSTNPVPPEISSQISMDYSMDTASLLGDGSLLGGQFAGDGSVITLGTTASENRSLISCVTRSTVHEASPGSGWNRSSLSPKPINEADTD